MDKKLDPTYRGILSVDDIRAAVAKLKTIDPAVRIKTGSLKPLDKIVARTGRSTYFDSIFGVHLSLDETLKPDEYKIIHQSGKEEIFKW